VSPGFNPEQVLTARVSLPLSKYETPAAQRAFQDELLRRARALPGVRSATAATYLPFTGLAAASSFWIEGRPAPRAGEEPSADIRAVDADYFRTLAGPVRRGTPFTDADARAASTPLVINEAAARRLFPDANPLGERIHMPWGDTLVGEIVAVVGNVKHAGLDSVPEPTLYWPLQKFPSVSTVSLALRTAGDPMALAAAVRRETKAIDPDQPLADVKPMLAYLGDSVERRRFNAALLGGFAAVALVLAAVGLYGVMSYTVAQHTRDFGIRIALGADARRVLGGVLGQALALVGVGLVVGVAGALAMTRVLTGLLYDVSATDPVVFAGIALLLTAVAAIASLVPARRATRVDPMVALRDE
jgi:putative ABC transport system permease protein